MRPEHYYLLTLSIKNDDQSDIRDFKRPIDIKYCFSCNQLEGEEWIKHLGPKEEQIKMQQRKSIRCTCDDEVDNCKLILYTNRI